LTVTLSKIAVTSAAVAVPIAGVVALIEGRP
jgi:hypothetical protein